MFGEQELKEPFYEDGSCVAQRPAEEDSDPQPSIFVVNEQGDFVVVRPDSIEIALDEGEFDHMAERSIEGYLDSDGALHLDTEKDVQAVVEEPRRLLDQV